MKYLLSLSGGLDSAVLLAHLLSKSDTESVVAASFDYGSKHSTYEWIAAAKIAEHFDVEHHLFNLKGVFSSFGSSLLKLNKNPIPEGHYQEESMRSTVVPGRNLIFASVLAGLAESMKLDAIALGTHAGDHFIYPDCRPAFNLALRNTIRHSSDGKVGVVFPFENWTKAQIVLNGQKLEVPFELTRTCYKDEPLACGKCGSCVERLESFATAGLEDPVLYSYRGELPKKGA